MKTHLESRHCDLELHRPILGEDTATFYLWNLSGQLVGYQQYRPTGDKKTHSNPSLGKYFTHTLKNTVAVWGVETLYRPGPIFITEGIFDACRLTRRGCAAIAVLANNPGTSFANWLFMLSRSTIAVCDNDAAGKRLARYADFAIFTSEKDLGEESEEFVINLIKQYEST